MPESNEYEYLTTPQHPEADALIARQMQRLALLHIEYLTREKVPQDTWDYYVCDDDDVQHQLRNAQ